MPAALEVGIASMSRQERSVISCTAADAAPLQPQSLVPEPPQHADRVEFEVELLKLTQVGGLRVQGLRPGKFRGLMISFRHR